ncbi:unnamed protein product [Nippostrongylus brasiliensis]|uniref:Cyclin-dependent kinase 20 (inferred by orthology to a human protein) n=1 Tax=Nippostrongylus brasiliensis TaxID=27835 RepID=A0A158R0N3_NIPBR|nr:unnamed protein product [Nippostrongylus brasiliensis]
MDSYEIVGPVGQGAYGIVLRARIKESGKTVAIKKMTVTSRNQLQILREVCALRNLHHSKILKLLDTFCSRDSLSLVTEFVPFHLNDDLKPENVLVSSHNLVKIADFGQACLYFPDEDREYEENGRSDLEQISKIFSILGTPSEHTWPSWNSMPDADKLIFDNIAPLKDIRSVVHTTNLSLIDLLKRQLCLESNWRWVAGKYGPQILSNGSFEQIPVSKALCTGLLISEPQSRILLTKDYDTRRYREGSRSMLGLYDEPWHSTRSEDTVMHLSKQADREP